MYSIILSATASIVNAASGIAHETSAPEISGYAAGVLELTSVYALPLAAAVLGIGFAARYAISHYEHTPAAQTWEKEGTKNGSDEQKEQESQPRQEKIKNPENIVTQLREEALKPIPPSLQEERKPQNPVHEEKTPPNHALPLASSISSNFSQVAEKSIRTSETILTATRPNFQLDRNLKLENLFLEGIRAIEETSSDGEIERFNERCVDSLCVDSLLDWLFMQSLEDIELVVLQIRPREKLLEALQLIATLHKTGWNRELIKYILLSNIADTWDKKYTIFEMLSNIKNKDFFYSIWSEQISIWPEQTRYLKLCKGRIDQYMIPFLESLAKVIDILSVRQLKSLKVLIQFAIGLSGFDFLKKIALFGPEKKIFIDLCLESSILDSEALKIQILEIANDMGPVELDEFNEMLNLLKPIDYILSSDTLMLIIKLSGEEKKKIKTFLLSMQFSTATEMEAWFRGIAILPSSDREEVLTIVQSLKLPYSLIENTFKAISYLPKNQRVGLIQSLFPKKFCSKEECDLLVSMATLSQEQCSRILQVSQSLAKQNGYPLRTVFSLGIELEKQSVSEEMMRIILPFVAQANWQFGIKELLFFKQLYDLDSSLEQKFKEKFCRLAWVITNFKLLDPNLVKKALLEDPEITSELFSLLERYIVDFPFFTELLSSYDIQDSPELFEIVNNFLEAVRQEEMRRINRYGFLPESQQLFFLEPLFLNQNNLGLYFNKCVELVKLEAGVLRILIKELSDEEFKWIGQQKLVQSLLHLQVDEDLENIADDLIKLAKSPEAREIYEQMNKPREIGKQASLALPKATAEELEVKLERLQAQLKALLKDNASSLNMLKAFSNLPFNEGGKNMQAVQDEINAIGQEIKETRLALKRMQTAGKQAEEPAVELEKKVKTLKAFKVVTNAQIAILQKNLQNRLFIELNYCEQDHKRILESEEYKRQDPQAKEELQQCCLAMQKIRLALKSTGQFSESIRLALQAAVSDNKTAKILVQVLHLLSRDLTGEDSAKILLNVCGISNQTLSSFVLSTEPDLSNFVDYQQFFEKSKEALHPKEETLRDFKARMKKNQDSVVSNLYALYLILLLGQEGELGNENMTILQLAKNIAQEKLHIDKDVSIEQIVQLFETDLMPNAVFTYASKLLEVANDEVMRDFGHFTSSAAKGTFQKERYRTENNQHLAKIEQATPAIFEQWKSLPQSLSYITTLYPGSYTFYPSQWIEEKQQHGHMQMPALDKSLFDETEDEKILFVQEAIKDLAKTKEREQQIECLQKLNKAVELIPDCEFKQDVADQLASLQKQSQISGKKVIVRITDDPRSIFLCGTRMQESCQRLDGYGDYNQCLLGYGLDGAHLLIEIIDIEKSETSAGDSAGVDDRPRVARAILKLGNGQEPLLVLEPTYLGRSYSREYEKSCEGAVAAIAALGAERLSSHLAAHESYRSSKERVYPFPIEFLGCDVAGGTYSDSACGVQPFCKYRIPANTLVLLHGKMPDALQIAEDQEEEIGVDFE